MQAAVHKECAAILRALASRHQIHVSIHGARKAIRRLRALLFLVEDRLPDAAAVDQTLERLGDGLSALRDAHVMVDTAEGLAARGKAKQWATAIKRLVRRRDGLIQQALARDVDFRRRRRVVERAARQLGDLPWHELEATDLRQALERSCHRVAKAEARAKADPLPANLHRWRRRVRKLRMQMEALTRIEPDIAKDAAKESASKAAKALHKLSDQLGAFQDKQMLRNVLRRMRGLPHRAQTARQLSEELATNQSMLVGKGVSVAGR
ncbi:hypothetical protein RHOFW104T7_02640 [Rhodanobacter thiooxydans]|uniref:CHAD domain-containing protein n=2 Tax=Rhodanobacter thiooxydans TaxID=416169 RepID=A0A154QCY4_9GAMM|nr:hypothetical protein UUA_15258 [Rhodanobacter thiooxydans LCS2]KZC22046.1 hypothetical protein RHOFW104T7_02640 [Rhodanobacter thiooxydans]